MNLTEILFSNWHIVLSFFTIAILYASVGFGGGSSYIAILAITSLSYTEIRATALICNIVVVFNSFILFYKNGFYNFKKTLPLVFTSIPLAFIGGYVRIEEKIFFILLGTALLIAGGLMLIKNKTIDREEINKNRTNNLFYGGFIGFISGMVGIGGGVFLAPLLHLTKWDTSKRIAATTTLFILVNSISGLGGQITNPEFHINPTLTFILATSAILGGQIGSRIGIHIIKQNTLKKGTAVLIIFIATKILWEHLAQQ